jgi:hypothetical protein
VEDPLIGWHDRRRDQPALAAHAPKTCHCRKQLGRFPNLHSDDLKRRWECYQAVHID